MTVESVHSRACEKLHVEYPYIRFLPSLYVSEKLPSILLRTFLPWYYRTRYATERNVLRRMRLRRTVVLLISLFDKEDTSSEASSPTYLFWAEDITPRFEVNR